jgi:integrase
LRALSEYLRVTKDWCPEVDVIFLTLSKPHRAAKPNTLAKNLKLLLRMAGIDDSVFSAHSFRAASTSKALHQGVPIGLILERANWASSSTFCRFYAKEIQKGKQFSSSVLKS